MTGDDLRARAGARRARHPFEARTRFPADDRAPHLARRFVREMLKLWDVLDLADSAELLTSELVSNVVRHAATPVDLTVCWHAPLLRVEVGDQCPKPPIVAERATLEGGYGLRLVSRLAREWGVDRDHDGKVVWFTLERQALF